MRKILGRAQLGERPQCLGAKCALQVLVASCKKPMELEIGSGHGRFLLARASNNLDTHFIGIEQEVVRIARMDVAARVEGITNLSLVRADAMAVLEFCLPENAMYAVYLFFPDPWPKFRHRKNRIFQQPFIDQVHRVLKVGGSLHVATDHDEYFGCMKEVMLGETRFVETEPLVRTEDELTDFELKFLAKNKRANAASWRKI